MLTPLNYLQNRKQKLVEEIAFLSDLDGDRPWCLTTFAKTFCTAAKFNTNAQMMVVFSWLLSVPDLNTTQNKSILRYIDTRLDHPTWRILAPAIRQVVIKKEPVSRSLKLQMLMLLRRHRGAYNALCIASKLQSRTPVNEPAIVLKAVNSWNNARDLDVTENVMPFQP